MTGQTCDKCRFSSPYESDNELLSCHRRAPSPYVQTTSDLLVIFGEEGREAHSSFPLVHFPLVGLDDWCGEFDARLSGEDEAYRELAEAAGRLRAIQARTSGD